MSQRKSWIAAKLNKLIGSSNETLVEYFNFLTEKPESAQYIVNELKTFANVNGEQFAIEDGEQFVNELLLKNEVYFQTKPQSSDNDSEHVKLTHKEIEYKKMVRGLVKDLSNLKNPEKLNKYYIPGAVKELKTNFVDGDEAGSNFELGKWEEQYLNSDMWEFGAEDADKILEEYKSILEDGVDFIKSLQTVRSENIELLENQDLRASEHLKIEQTRNRLPIYASKKDLLEAIKAHQILIIEGETGSGKTTQLPQYLHEAGYTADGRKIGCTQPERMVPISIAKKVSKEMRVELGEEVGYSIRFQDCSSERTIIKYMTDDMMIKEFQHEPELAAYSVIIIDEAHERSLHTDILFVLVKDIARSRKDLKILISGSTLDADKFCSFFDDAPIFKICGRRYPVDIYHAKTKVENIVESSVASVMQIHVTQPLGDVLVFLTGQADIEFTKEALEDRMQASKLKGLIVLPLYGNLPLEIRAQVFERTPPGARKVILATNIAETWLPTDNIIYIIDCGFCKQKSYNPETGLEWLEVTPISKAVADQRARRAGRVATGKCFRLYESYKYEHDMKDNTVPEIQRTNLAEVFLLLKNMKMDLRNFEFMDPPSDKALNLAAEQLSNLGALNADGDLTSIGIKMSEFPLDPMTSKMIIASEKYKCSEEILTIAAMLSVSSSVFYRPKDKKKYADTARQSFVPHPEALGDHFMLLNVYNTWAENDCSIKWCYENYIQFRSMNRARDIRDQLKVLLKRVNIELSTSKNTIAIRKAIASGFIYNVARYNVLHYKIIMHQRTAEIHPSSCVRDGSSAWLIYNDLLVTSKEYMRLVVEVESSWLIEVAPSCFKAKILDNRFSKKPTL